MTQPLVSIVIPVYNSEDTLEKCLSSIENQKTLREFLMVNRGVGILQMSPLRKSLLKNWKKFAQHPILTLGFMFYAFVYYSSSISGFLVAVVKNS